MRPLSLRASPDNWQKFIARRLSASFRSLAEKVWRRDRYTCQYCDFQAKDYMDVVNHDQDYSNNKASNLVTACGFCSQCFFLESIGLDDMSGGQLIFLPEMSQEHLNSFCHVLFCAMSSKAAYQDNAQIIYRHLKSRNKPIEDILGEGGSDPRQFGITMVQYQSLNEGKSLSPILKDIRLLPLQAKFNKQLEAWAHSATGVMEMLV
ncbi:MAG: type IVB secretion system protein IcmJDotN [Gammaproteobacteria bacterium]|nr:type IVB secretion system protein IcmJDotN [Gammaproteobacteria bacterium]